MKEKNWKRELSKLLLNYRATPHTTTIFAPAELLYNRKICTKLPQIIDELKKQHHEQVKERDTSAKKKMKTYADARSRAKELQIKEGDVVLVRQPKQNKLSMKFDPVPYKVVRRKCSRVTAVRNGRYISRNVSLFKKTPAAITRQPCGNSYENGDDDYPDHESGS